MIPLVYDVFVTLNYTLLSFNNSIPNYIFPSV